LKKKRKKKKKKKKKEEEEDRYRHCFEPLFLRMFQLTQNIDWTKQVKVNKTTDAWAK
jgi:hypothetical protein